MDQNSDVEKLFFELASKTRLDILRELKNENLKMQEIARRLDLTATEVFRQLERLSTSLLVQKKPDGTFTLAEYGKLVLQLSSSVGFVCKYKEYFSTHDVTRLPNGFVNRLGELSQTELVMDTVEMLNKAEKALMDAEAYGWGIAEGTIPQQMGPIMEGAARKGIKLRFLLPEIRLPSSTSPSPSVKNLEIRGISELPAIVVLTDKEGAICFRQVGGRVDYAGFFGNDPAFLNWVKDLFEYYWNMGKRV
jgi:predicted transcriptional regulator